jgi:hypothetical protein
MNHGDAVRALYLDSLVVVAAYARILESFQGEAFWIPPDASRRHEEAKENLRVLGRLFMMADLIPPVFESEKGSCP